MTQPQTLLLEASLQRVKQNREKFAEACYARLFYAHPELKPLFAGTDMKKQGNKLYASLVLMVENLRQPDELRRVLLPLGMKHVAYGATPSQYAMVGNSIIQTLAQFLGEEWSPELESGWKDGLDAVSLIMMEGAGMTPAPTHRSSIHTYDSSDLQSGWLTPALMDQVEGSFEWVKRDKMAFSETFYRRLFEENPQLQPLFANTDMKKQGGKLYATLVLLVENLRHPAELERVLLPLGSKHRGYGAIAEHYPMVNRAILWSLEQHLGSEWTPEIAHAWEETCNHVKDIMLRGAQEESAANFMQPRLNATASTDRNDARSQPGQYQASISGRRKQRGYSTGFADWFYNTSLSTIIGLWALIGVTLIGLSFAFPSIRGVVVFANPLSLLLALFLFIRETPERKKQFHYHAWSTIDNAAHVKSSNARFLALQDLCADGVSLKGLPLEGAELVSVDLQGADLSSANLAGCNLSGAQLDKADLNSTDLHSAHLSGATLSGSNLGFANLAGANCSSTDFSNANLLFADVSGANLSGANLSGAKLSGANFNETYLGGADLRNSDITLEGLEGAFLVGATLPDGTIARDT